MNDQPLKAWQPLTFGGVARYGHDSVGRLFFACFIVSILTASTVLWTIWRAWMPVFEQAITRLPNAAEIRGGKLTSPESLRLAENTFLSVHLDAAGDRTPASLGDIQFVLGPTEARIRSIFGNAAFAYRPEWTVPLAEIDPWWGAWKPAVVTYLFCGTMLFVAANWLFLGTIYALWIRLLAAIAKRRLSLWGAWKLGIAALLPGAIFLTVGIFLYGAGQIRLVDLVVAWGLHFVIGWVFVIGATLRLPIVKKGKANPFTTGESEEETEAPRQRAEKNPFRSRKRK